MSHLGRALLDRTEALVDVPSVSHGEATLADEIEAELRNRPGLEVTRIADNVIARAGSGPGRLLLGGHLDTVPPKGNAVARRDRDCVHGVGTADMKGGLAILLGLASEPRSAPVTYVFYAKEEVAREHSGLLEIEVAAPELLDCDVAVLLEPTGGIVEAGCQGVLRVVVHLGGRSAHSARPWTGVNAIHRAAGVLAAVDGFVERRPVLDGCEFRESLQAVRIEGGGAANVIPDAVRITLSHRFAPDRDAAAAFAGLERLLAGRLDPGLGDSLEAEDDAPAARPALDHPVLAGLVAESRAPARAKLAWTDVAFFAERGRPAANFGPGDPLLAHTAEERVEAGALESTYRVLDSVLGTVAAGREV